MGVEIHRMALMLALKDKGWDPGNASLYVLAMHPLDDAPVPGRAFEKEVRKVSRRCRKLLRGGAEESSTIITFDALVTIQELAIKHGELYYQNRYTETLKQWLEENPTH